MFETRNGVTQRVQDGTRMDMGVNMKGNKSEHMLT